MARNGGSFAFTVRDSSGRYFSKSVKECVVTSSTLQIDKSNCPGISELKEPYDMLSVQWVGTSEFSRIAQSPSSTKLSKCGQIHFSFCTVLRNQIGSLVTVHKFLPIGRIRIDVTRRCVCFHSWLQSWHIAVHFSHSYTPLAQRKHIVVNPPRSYIWISLYGIVKVQ